MKSTLICTTLIAAAALVVGCSDHPDPFPGEGVTNSYRDYIPDSAVKVAEAVGSVTYTTDSLGTAYLVDVSRLDQTTKKTAVPHVLYSTLLLNGQTFTVDGTAQTIMTSGSNNVTASTIKATTLKPDVTYQIFFDKKKHNKM